MRAFPIIPTIIMILICISLFILILKTTKRKTHMLMVIFLFLINQRYMIPTGTTTTLSNNMDVLFVIDSTLSMNAEDYKGTEKRLNAVKEDCKKIIEELNGAKFSVITFNNEVNVLVPFTKDSYMAYESIDIIEPIEELYARGSSLNTPKKDIMQILSNSYKKDPDRVRILFFISDGEITDESKLESYSSLKKYVNDGAVLGYGTEKGGYMKYKDKYADEEDEEKYIMDYYNYNDNKAVSKIDEKNLKEIASDIGIPYIHMDKYGRISKKINNIKNIMTSEMASSQRSSYEDIYYIFAFPLLILIIIELLRVRRNVQ